MAQRYSDWARQQVERANQTLNPKARNDRLALAEYYSQLAEGELAAAKRSEGAVKSSQLMAKVLPDRELDENSNCIVPLPSLGIRAPVT
jgi:hypothetical protein